MYSTDNFAISCSKTDKNLFSIVFPYPCPVLCLSIVKSRIIRGATITDNYRTVVFKACSVDTLQKADTLQKRAAMALSLVIQLKYMVEECSHSFLGYNRENVVVVDGDKFLFLDSSLVYKISEDDTLTVTCPFDKDDFFLSPEMEKVNVLPSYVQFKTAYYSLGLLFLSCFKERERDKYRNTKLGYLIKRCLVKEPEKRSILFI